MKNCLMDSFDQRLLRKRGLIESVFAQLKFQYPTLHHRHRSPINFLINLMAGITAYFRSPNKPSLNGVFMHLKNVLVNPKLALKYYSDVSRAIVAKFL